MQGSSSLKLLRAIDVADAESTAPTTASAWVNTVDISGHFFGKARCVFTKPALGNADNEVTVTVWAREGDVIFPLAQKAMTDDLLIPNLDLGTCPPSWSFYPQVTTLTGTSSDADFDVYIQCYNDDE